MAIKPVSKLIPLLPFKAHRAIPFKAHRAMPMMVKRVAFIHPDLGIGGAERLIVDAALALQSEGHQVELFTAHHDPTHCFSETKDGTLKVTSAGDWLPRSCCGKGYAVWAYIRMVYVAIYLFSYMLFGDKEQKFDVIICDQISACVPILRLTGAKVIFYCHFPDQLLTERKSFLKKVYRWPIDKLEERTTGMAHAVLVNSKFTSMKFHSTFKSLSHVHPMVLYPSLNFATFDQEPEHLADLFPNSVQCLFLSINRFERKKNLPLAVKAFAMFLEDVEPSKRCYIHLALAGGYDERVVENKEHYIELRTLVEKLGVGDNVTFVRSFTDSQKISLLHRSRAMVYTPSNEHFGICPLEGMYMQLPVIAANSGGPLETVLDGKTGFLCEPTPEAFSHAMGKVYRAQEEAHGLGKAGKKHVIQNFSFAAFTRKLNAVVLDLVTKK
jgi:alpha-1,3/alpha-1,6-mannosyltransferase